MDEGVGALRLAVDLASIRLNHEPAPWTWRLGKVLHDFPPILETQGPRNIGTLLVLIHRVGPRPESETACRRCSGSRPDRCRTCRPATRRPWSRAAQRARPSPRRGFHETCRASA